MSIIMQLLSAALAALCYVFYSMRYFQMLQLNGYSGAKLSKWTAGNGFYVTIISCGIVLAAIIADFFGVKTLLFLPAVALFGFFVLYKIPSSVPVRVTKRLLRLMFTAGAVMFAITFLLLLAKLAVASYIITVLSPFLIMLVNVCLKPMEKAISKKYLELARKKLDKINPIKIAVTGSYGKTTLKNMLTAMLATRYRVCATPESYNTPSGISLAVNNNLSYTDEIFVAEMGARRIGDIAFLTNLVVPDIAVITAVGNQHLETFGTLENIIKAKSELLQNLPCGARAYFNGDNAAAKYMYDSYDGNKTLTGRCGQVRYENAVMSVKGLEFDLVSGAKREHIFTKLVGKHIPQMICLAAAVALSLGISMTDIKNAVLTLKPVAHRLQMMYNGSDVIIDDSFSSNEAGFVSAMEVLSQFSYLIKVVITPGVVELGKHQYEINHRLGGVAAKHCDYLIVIGKNASALKSGAIAGGLSPRCISEARSRSEAMEHYKKIGGSKAVLFENDLPDNY